MLKKIILCATTEKLTAGLWQMGRLSSFQEFEAGEQGTRDFEQFLQQQPNVSIYLLVDSVEEDYRIESLPHTSGNARQELLQRKLNQTYRSTEFRAAHFITRERTKRKDDRFLFAALNNPEFLHGWISCIERQHAPLVGVYLLSMVSQLIVRKSKLMQPHILLTEKLSSGLRQSYLHNGRLRISRLAPVPLNAKEKLGFQYLIETEKTSLYLSSQRFITRDTPLTMVLPALTDDVHVIARGLEQEQGLQCINIDLPQFAKGLQLDPALLHANPELLHMHLLAKGNVPDNLAPSKLIKHYQVNFFRQLINLATAAILMVGMALSGLLLKDGYELEESVSLIKAQTEHQERQYAEVAKNFPVTPIPAADLKLAVEMHQTLLAKRRLPVTMMQVVSRVMDTAPQVQINRFYWLHSNNPEQADEQAVVGRNNNPVITQPEPASAAVVSGDATAMYEIAYINGEIKPFNGDYRAALSTVNQLIERLRNNPLVMSASVVEEPVNVSSFSNLEGSTVDERGISQQTATFKLRVALKIEEPVN
jgi:hypothetical protein